jgi:hypothetical protein
MFISQIKYYSAKSNIIQPNALAFSQICFSQMGYLSAISQIYQPKMSYPQNLME